MAEGKKSFIAYCDWQETFEELTDEEAGKLIKHLFNYVNDKNPEASDKLTKMCFIPIKQSLKRDLNKYEGYINKQKVNGAKGGRPKKTQITQRLISEPKKADSVSVSDSVNVNNNKREIAGVVYDLSNVKDHTDYYNKLVKDMANEYTWIESLYRNEKVSKGKLGKLVDLFIIHLMSKDIKDRPANLSDFKQHCASWIRLKFRIGSLLEYSSVKPKGSI
jgi:hypothetical protein